jgi:isopentenyl-diphosphate delta-isomerase
MKEPQVILVNERDEQLGTLGKLEAHRHGILHRAFSVFLFDRAGRMLLQQRAVLKYHGGGLWSNACCSHPLPGEAVDEAATRRLREELGIEAGIDHIFSFTYRADVENGLIEHEYDHVFAGIYDGDFFPDPDEVASVRYERQDILRDELLEHPERFTKWFRMAYPRLEAWWEQRTKTVG